MEKYKEEGCEPFCYEKPDGKIVTMPYISVLLDVLEDKEKMSDRIYESFNLSKK
jgi:TfoX/Sxy family transcriptional regulator of competence genes